MEENREKDACLHENLKYGGDGNAELKIWWDYIQRWDI